MNKEIIHQAAQAHAERSFIQPLNAQGSNVYWAYCSIRYRKHCKLAEHFKARRFGIKNKLKPAAKPLIKKSRRGSV
jgi:hypothetical protein